MENLSRSTPATADVLGVLLAAGDHAWGLQIAKKARRPTGSVYPILARLESAGWVESTWEEEDGRRGARRRLYKLTPDGAQAAKATITHLQHKTANQPVSFSPNWQTS